MKRAIHAATVHAFTNIRCAHIGCSLLVNGRYVRSTTNCPSSHAECRILKDVGAAAKRRPIDIIVVRVKKEPFGHLGMAKPCKHCLIRCKELGVRGVYYSNEDGKICYELVKDMQNEHTCKISI